MAVVLKINFSPFVSFVPKKQFWIRSEIACVRIQPYGSGSAEKEEKLGEEPSLLSDPDSDFFYRNYCSYDIIINLSNFSHMVTQNRLRTHEGKEVFPENINLTTIDFIKYL